MPKAGDNNIGACGTLQGYYTPQLRMYYEVENGKVYCDVFDLNFLGKTRNRKEAIRRGKAWQKQPNADGASETAWDILHNWRVMGVKENEVRKEIMNALASASTPLEQA